MRFLFLGAGGIGGYYGGRLVESGADVTFLVRPRRKDLLVRHGLRIRSRFGDADIKVTSKTRDELQKRFDVVVLTCKAYDLPHAIDDVRDAVAPGGAVLPLLNGISHIDRLAAVFGRERVMGGVAKIGAAVDEEGTIRHTSESCAIVFGEIDGRMSDRARNIEESFSLAKGVNAKATDNINGHLWEKFVSLGVVASLTTLFRANIGEIARTPDGSRQMNAAFDSALAAAAHRKIALSDGFAATTRLTFSDTSSPGNSSLLRDVEAGNMSESEQITGDLLREIVAANADDTIIRLAYTHLKAYEQRRNVGRL